MTFKPGDVVRSLFWPDNVKVVKRTYSNFYGDNCIEFENGTNGMPEYFKLIPENEKPKVEEVSMTFKPGDFVRSKYNNPSEGTYEGVVKRIFINELGDESLELESGSIVLSCKFKLVPEEEKPKYTFKPGDFVRSKFNHDDIRVVKKVFTTDQYNEYIDFEDGYCSYADRYELILENEKPIKDELQENLDKAIEIRQLKQELDIVYQALSYCLYDSDCLSHSHFDWKIETIKKMIELRNLKNK